MATATKTLFRGAATTTLTTNLYTVPSATTTVITNVAVTNSAATTGTFTISVGTAASEVTLFDAVSIPGNTTVFVDLKQVLAATEVIDGGASATTIKFHISGIEIS